MRKQTLLDLALGGYRQVEFLTQEVLSEFQLERHSHLAQQRLIVDPQMVQMNVSLTHMNAIKLLMSVQVLLTLVQEFMYDEQGQWMLITSDQHPSFKVQWRLQTTLQAPFLKEKKGVRFSVLYLQKKRNLLQWGRSRCILDRVHGLLLNLPSWLTSFDFMPYLFLSGTLFQSHRGSDISSLLWEAKTTSTPTPPTTQAQVTNVSEFVSSSKFEAKTFITWKESLSNAKEFLDRERSG
ncbi:hypothetical protein Tco_0854042 [Tanacetum coccineum]